MEMKNSPNRCTHSKMTCPRHVEGLQNPVPAPPTPRLLPGVAPPLCDYG